MGRVWRRQWHPTPVPLPGKSHGRSLVGCNPSGSYESGMTEQLHFHFSLSHIGEGNGNPLQCSCLENPRDGGAWWAAVYGVTQSQTQPKWLSSSSSPAVGRVKGKVRQPATGNSRRHLPPRSLRGKRKEWAYLVRTLSGSWLWERGCLVGAVTSCPNQGQARRGWAGVWE